LSRPQKVRVVLYGVGAVGSLIAHELLRRKGVQIVGAIDTAKDKVGKDLGEVVRADKRLGIPISNDVESVLSKSNIDIVVHATSSFLRNVYPQIVEVIEKRVSVISTCEELSYPYITDAKIAEQIDRLAKERRVTVLATGINPGFVMDALPIVLTGVCKEVKKIEVKRVMNAGGRRVPFQRKIGAGLTLEEFREKTNTKAITGHIGLEQSIAMIADALGWKLEKIQVNPVEPVTAKKREKSEAMEVEPFHVAGLRQRATGIRAGEPVLVLDFEAYIGADEEYDAITIYGTPEIRQKITPCIHGDIGTVAIIINSIPKVLNAPHGLVTMKDLPIPSASIEDMRIYVRR